MNRELRRCCIVGGNAVSAFLSWRLQATNACDVTLVWKANYQAVAQYGVSFKSQLFGNERFKPRYVVQSPEEAANQQASFDYVLLCVKALPDVYNLADIIQSVVTPQHTCILINTTNTLGVEKQLEERFPTNVVLSLVSGADLTQLGSSEFEHTGSTEIWVGPASKNSAIPESIQRDMSEALAMTLTTAQVDCKVSNNIKQQQYERMIGPIAFHPISVLFETPILSDLIRLPGVHELISSVMDELLELARAQECKFPSDFKENTISTMITPTQDPSTMYQDFTSRRPMEVETYLGTPVQFAKDLKVKVPRIETLYTMLRHVNMVNKDRPQTSPQSAIPPSPAVVQPPPRNMSLSNGPPPRQLNGSISGPPRPMRGPNMGPPMGPPGRRGPPPVNGFRGPPNSYPPRGPSQMQRRPSYEENNLDEFSHVVLYDELGDGADATNFGENGGPQGPSLRERELMLRERELQLKQQEMSMRSRGNGRRPTNNRHQDFDDDDDDDDYFDPMAARGPPPPSIDPDNFDMMSVTSRRTKRTNSQNQLRKDVFTNGPAMRQGGYPRPGMNRQRTSTQILSDMPILGANILDNPMMGFSSNRYGNVDRKEMADESRANSLTASRLQEIGMNGGPYPGPPSRRTSRSPGNPFGPSGRMPGRPSPPNDPYAQQGPPRNGRPSPPSGMPAPVPRYPPTQGNMMHPHQVEQAGVSKPLPPLKAPVKSLTGSASASAGSADSGSANIESEPSAHSSTSSFAPRHMLATH
ncbi:alcohol dehydrogenase [Exophiala aquamarina CBS 119918]|uniref:Alcohol dehydrogenase n=1 Tax=Exophiala aquamarina CBS 119918 TaxID=1182545 RepID=A0A072PMF4_9EURO|nr:alcohol dehydrogenase [Exophiala aquamarina CBS 119918]KEF60523.1 alcohol dehydrogenase [Exophiala aquamarina CBS 119918]